MFQRVVQTRAQWGSMLVMVILIGLMTLIPTRLAAEELPAVVQCKANRSLLRT